ncbi:MAG: hypothetical protein O7D32_09820 [bacterium]|nr:hypothetical protein [bacterium]
MGFEFLRRVHRTSIISGLVLFSVASTYLGFTVGASLALGCLWSLANIFVIEILVKQVTTPGPTNRLRVTLVFLVKVPALYGIGALLLSTGFFSIKGLVLGFSWPLAVIVLKVLGLAIVRANARKAISETVRP